MTPFRETKSIIYPTILNTCPEVEAFHALPRNPKARIISEDSSKSKAHLVASGSVPKIIWLSMVGLRNMSGTRSRSPLAKVSARSAITPKKRIRKTFTIPWKIMAMTKPIPLNNFQNHPCFFQDGEIPFI